MTTVRMTTVRLWMDGEPVQSTSGTTLASLMLQHRPRGWRRSLGGSPRAPLCGMGNCFECAVWVDGRSRLACLTTCAEGQEVVTLAEASAEVRHD